MTEFALNYAYEESTKTKIEHTVNLSIYHIYHRWEVFAIGGKNLWVAKIGLTVSI